MKHYILAAVLTMTCVTSAYAQSSGSASSTTMSTLNSTVDGRTYIDGRTLIDQRGGGDSTLRTAPQVSAPSMSSGHPCAYTPASASLSIIGGGIGAGGQKIDDACMLGQLGRNKASVHMIASRSVAACKALRASGDLAPGTLCGRDEVRAAERTQTANPTGVSARNAVAHNDSGEAVLWRQCERMSDGRIKIAYKNGVSKKAAQAQCSALLRR